MASPTPPQSSTPQPLDISDLIRPLSPSPLPPASRASSPAQSRSSASPEPIDRAELDEIRSKVLEMGIVRDGRKNSIARLDKTWSDMSTFGEDRERVLAEMVLRLTHPSVPLPSQLFAQAETISTLNKQRDFILSRDEDDRVRWDAEREAWRRVAGVLLERSQKEGAGIREDLERENSQLQADNRALKTRLYETNSRLHVLESELNALRPALLIRPATPPPAEQPVLDTPFAPAPPSQPRPVGRPRKIDRPPSEDDLDPGGGVGADTTPLKVSTRHHQTLKSPSLADARTEHLLLAARRIGRERVAMLSPPTTYSPEQHEIAHTNSSVPPVTPRTPQARRPSTSHVRTPSRPSQSGASRPSFSALLPTHTPQTLPNTDTPSGLASLLSAARTVFDHDMQDGSPAKRRRLDSASEAGSSQSTGAGRVMSALDVLADQAAAFSSQGSGAPADAGGLSVDAEHDAPRPISQSRSRASEEPAMHARKESIPPQPALPKPSSSDPKGKGKGRAALDASPFPSLGPAIDLRPSPPTGRQPSSRREVSAIPTTPGTFDLSTPPSHPTTSETPSSPLPHFIFDSPASSVPTAVPTPVSTRTRALAPSPAVSASTANPFSSPLGPPLSHHPEEAGKVSKLQSEQLLRLTNDVPARRQRSPYQKWSKEEDELLSKAVAKYGQKWDLVQKALPTRGYHQVRQRWLRKLGMFDAKPDLSSYQTNATGLDKSPAPKLGLAPLSSEMVLGNFRGNNTRFGGPGFGSGSGASGSA